MRLSGRSARLVRICGGIWIVLAPILWLMAAISSVESDVAYRVQLVAFSAAAIVGLVSGVCALLAHTWAARGLFLVSSLGVVVLFRDCRVCPGPPVCALEHAQGTRIEVAANCAAASHDECAAGDTVPAHGCHDQTRARDSLHDWNVSRSV